MILKKVEETGFVTSLEFEELLDWKFCKNLKASNSDIDCWKEYNRGNVLSYVWLKTRFGKEEAKRRANQVLWINF